jgi:hypothetical protein
MEGDDDQGATSSSDEALDSATGMTESESESDSDSENSEDAFDPSSQEDEEEEEVEEPTESEIDSDNLDEDDARGKASKNKRKSVGKTSTSGRGVPAKKAKTETVGSTKLAKNNGHAPIEGYEDEEDDDDEIELEEGQEIAGRIYPAPKTGQGGSGTLSPQGRREVGSLLTYSSTRSDIAKHPQLPEEPANTRAQR